jgi:outer membrane protein assembly factor BamA
MLCCRRTLIIVLLWMLGSVVFAQKDTSWKRVADTSFTTDTTQRFIIGNIAISGNKRTKDYIVLREVSFRPGDTLKVKDLLWKMQRARELLMSNSLFIDVAVYVTRREQQILFVNIDVKERWYFFPVPYFELIDRNFNEWWVTHKASLRRVNYGVDLKQNNLSGRNDNLNLRLINGYNQQVNLGYSQPYANNKLTQGFGVGFTYGRQHELNYASDSNKQSNLRLEEEYIKKYYGFSLSYSYRPGIKSYYGASLSVVHESFNDTVLKLNRQYLPYGRTAVTYPQLSAYYNYVNVDYAPYPMRGFTASASITKRGFNKYMDMWSFYGAATYVKPFTSRFQVKLAGAFNVKLPFDQPFYNSGLLGYGALSMRGMEYYVVDGVAGVVSSVTLRYKILDFIFKNPIHIKNHERIPFRFMFKVFNDFGYAYSRNLGNSRFNNRLLRTYGLGLDVLSIYDWVFTIEYSFDALGKGNMIYHN